MKPYRFRQGNSWGWVFGVHPNGCLDFRFACTSLLAFSKLEGAMREKGYKEDPDKMTKAQLISYVSEMRLSQLEIAERSDRRLCIIRRLNTLIDGCQEAGSLPYQINDLVLAEMEKLCREGVSHTKPGL